MKIKIVTPRTLTASLISDRKDPKLEVSNNGGGARLLGPKELIPGTKDVTAAELVFAYTTASKDIKPAQRRAINKFVDAGRPLFKDAKPEKPVSEAEKIKEIDWINEIEGAAIELNQAAAALELIMSSDTITGAGGTAEDFDNLRAAMWHLAPSIIENSQKLYSLVNSAP